MSTYAGAVWVHDGPMYQDRDYENGFYDPGTITGTVKTKVSSTVQVPTECDVYAVRDTDMVAVRKTRSNATTGAYLFRNLDKTVTYSVIAVHPTRGYRAVIADGVTPA